MRPPDLEPRIAQLVADALVLAEAQPGGLDALCQRARAGAAPYRDPAPGVLRLDVEPTGAVCGWFRLGAAAGGVR